MDTRGGKIREIPKILRDPFVPTEPNGFSCASFGKFVITFYCFICVKVEHIIREDYLVEAMEMLELYCDLLLARFGLIETQQ